MLTELIDEILAAEAAAAEIGANAAAEAKAVRLSSDFALQERREAFERERRAEREQAYAAAEAEAAAAYNAAIKEAEREAAQLVRAAEKNMQKAVGVILGQI